MNMMDAPATKGRETNKIQQCRWPYKIIHKIACLRPELTTPEARRRRIDGHRLPRFIRSTAPIAPRSSTGSVIKKKEIGKFNSRTSVIWEKYSNKLKFSNIRDFLIEVFCGCEPTKAANPWI